MNADVIINALRISDVMCRSVQGSRPYIPPTGKSPRPLFSMALWEGWQRAADLEAKLPIAYYGDAICAMAFCTKAELAAQLETELGILHVYNIQRSKGFINAVIAYLKTAPVMDE
jgi:hypothetical protein